MIILFIVKLTLVATITVIIIIVIVLKEAVDHLAPASIASGIFPAGIGIAAGTWKAGIPAGT